MVVAVGYIVAVVVAVVAVGSTAAGQVAGQERHCLGIEAARGLHSDCCLHTDSGRRMEGSQMPSWDPSSKDFSGYNKVNIEGTIVAVKTQNLEASLFITSNLLMTFLQITISERSSHSQRHHDIDRVTLGVHHHFQSINSFDTFSSQTEMMIAST